MDNKHGDFIWYELMTSDADAAQAFYSGLLGWNFKDSGNPDMDYRIFASAISEVGGLMPLTKEMTDGGARPFWTGYIAVDDVDTSVTAMKAAGAAVHMPPWDIPGVGRVAFMADPQGAMFYVMKPIPAPDNPDAVSKSFAAMEPMVGHCAWNELNSDNPEAAKSFYGDIFGWQKEGEMDMGPMGAYEFLKVGDDRAFMLGAIMPKPQPMPFSAWIYYFRVADIDMAAEYIKSNGGKMIQEPIEIPGGEYSLNAFDPQGAGFGLVGLRK